MIFTFHNYDNIYRIAYRTISWTQINIIGHIEKKNIENKLKTRLKEVLELEEKGTTNESGTDETKAASGDVEGNKSGFEAFALSFFKGSVA